MMKEYLLELADIYRGLDGELDKYKVGCKRCGTCCNFTSFDHVLFVSALEAEYLLEGVGGRLPVSKVEGVCPFLAHNQCSVRDVRTLGCRVFFCDVVYKRDVAQGVYNRFYMKIKEISLKYQLRWAYLPSMECLRRGFRQD